MRSRTDAGRSSAISSTDATPDGEADTPATATTRPLYIGTGHDLGADVVGADTDRPWPAEVEAEGAELPDFTPERRWNSVVLGGLWTLVLAGLVAAVVTVAHRSTAPPGNPPAPTTTMTTTVEATSSAPPTSSLVVPPPAEPAPTTPAYSSPTATASSVVPPPPPPAVQPNTPKPKPNIRERLHDLFPKWFPKP